MHAIPACSSASTAVITLTGGTILLMWIGEQITSRGVGNGISLIIFAGIVARFPTHHRPGAGTGAHRRDQSASHRRSSLVCAMALVGFIVFMERAQRRLLVQYPKRQVGNNMFGGESSHLPLKLNVSGVIPPIFASSILLMPTTDCQLQRAEHAGLAADHRRPISAAASRSI